MMNWQPIETAPRDATEIIARVPNRAGCRGVLIVHFAQGGGEDQPRFGPDWFYWTGYGFQHLDPPPTEWMPIPTGDDAPGPYDTILAKMAEALRDLLAFDSRAYIKQSDLARDLLAAKLPARKILVEYEAWSGAKGENAP